MAPPKWLQPDPPKDFQPPPDFKPPPDFEPPEGWEPPPGFEDWEGEYPFDVPPQCPPPVVRDIKFTPNQLSIGNSPFGGSSRSTFVAPNFTLAVGLYVNVSAWQGRDYTLQLQTPDSNRSWNPDTEQGAPGNLAGPSRNPAKSWEFRSYEEWGQEEAAPSGNYTLTMTTSFATEIRATLEGKLFLACGGMFS